MKEEGAAAHTSFPSWADGLPKTAQQRGQPSSEPIQKTALGMQAYREYHYVAPCRGMTEHNTEGKECHQ